MKPFVFEQARKIWSKLAVGDQLTDIKFELEAHKKILNIFQAGDFYYYIFNVKEAKFEFLSAEVENVLGYTHNQIDLNFFLTLIHLEDQPWFLGFENKVAEFFDGLTLEQIPDYKVRYDYRIKKNNGEYIRILQQVVTIQYSKTGGVYRTFGVHTDISHIKLEGKPVLSFVGLNGKPSYIDIEIKNPFLQRSFHITEREKQILFQLAEGLKTKEIALNLSLSPETVSTHRKNLIRKVNARNSSNLIIMAIKNGWI